MEKFIKELNDFRFYINDDDFMVADIIEKRLLKMYEEAIKNK